MLKQGFEIYDELDYNGRILFQNLCFCLFTGDSWAFGAGIIGSEKLIGVILKNLIITNDIDKTSVSFPEKYNSSIPHTDNGQREGYFLLNDFLK